MFDQIVDGFVNGLLVRFLTDLLTDIGFEFDGIVGRCLIRWSADLLTDSGLDFLTDLLSCVGSEF